MARRSIRMMLWGIIVLAAAGVAYFFWIDESAARREANATRAFHASANAATRALMDLRTAQQAYVAAGQGEDFWESKVTASIASAREALSAMQSTASSSAFASIQSAARTLEDFEQMDRRAREYARGGQRLMASDVIFSDGLEMTEAALTEVARARSATEEARDQSIQTVRQRQWIALGAGALGICLLTLLLVPVPRRRGEIPLAVVEEPAVTRPPSDQINLRALDDDDEPRWKSSSRPALTPDAPALPKPNVDLAAVAALCSDLARVTDTRSLPPILERTSNVLDAAGIVLWIADPDARELAPILAHGYSPQLVTRLGIIPRDAENVTAAAFRTALLQTVKADAVSNGAIAAPLVTPAGCVGVMAAEVRSGGEQEDTRLAAATIVAAQLATLVGPPIARGSKAEATGTASR